MPVAYDFRTVNDYRAQMIGNESGFFYHSLKHTIKQYADPYGALGYVRDKCAYKTDIKAGFANSGPSNPVVNFHKPISRKIESSSIPITSLNRLIISHV